MLHPISYKRSHTLPVRLLCLTGALIGIALLLAWGEMPAQAAATNVEAAIDIDTPSLLLNVKAATYGNPPPYLEMGTDVSFVLSVDLAAATENSIAATGFVLLYENSNCFSVRDPEGDVSGIPDGFSSSVTDNGNGLNIAIFDKIDDEIEVLPSGTIASIIFTKDETCQKYEETISFTFGDNPEPSFGNIFGDSVDGTATGMNLRVFSNRAPTISGSNTINTSVQENQQFVADVYATDPDGDNLTYSLSGSDANRFSINGSGRLQFQSPPNYESPGDDGQDNIYVVDIIVTDTGGLQDSQTVNVRVTNVNEAPTTLNLSGNLIAENSPRGTVVGTFTTSDPDADSHIYTLVSGNTDNSFSISGNQLTTASILDYETGSSYNLRVQTSDNGGLSLQQNFTIYVSNVYEADRGDCNKDNTVDAGDFSAIALEIFDTDTNLFGDTVDSLGNPVTDGRTFWLNAASGDYAGDPQGCDANASHTIEVGDILGAITTFFDSGTAEVRAFAHTPSENTTAALLRLDAQNDRAESATLSQPLSLASNGHAVAAGAFHFRYDPAQISLDSADADGNGLPDGIQSHLPAGVMAWAKIDAAAGDIQFAFFSLGQPQVVGDGALLHFQWQPLESGDADALASVHIVKASLGDTEGNSIPVDFGQTALKSLYLPTLYR